jgi:hypothetical protein
MDKLLPIGSISHGTMLETDLVPDFMSMLETVDKKRACKLRRAFPKVFRMLDGIKVRNYSEEDYNEDIRTLCWEYIFDALNDYTPVYCYFGSHMGDGSDYGVWICNESIETDIHDGILFSVEDLSEVDDKVKNDLIIPKSVILVNDHGNMTLFNMTAEFEDKGNTWELAWTYHEVWSVV